MFAILETGGKQYKVCEGDKVVIERLDTPSEDVAFENVLLRGEGSKIEIGTPFVKGAVVSGKIIANGRAKKKTVFHFKSKTGRRTLRGHRQLQTTVLITKI